MCKYTLKKQTFKENKKKSQGGGGGGGARLPYATDA